MHLNSIKLARFRNLTEVEITPSPRLNVLFGPNGSGKTNLCEAVHFVSTGNNLKGSRQSELINWDADDTLVKLQLDENDQVIVYIQRREGKQVRYNSKEIRQSKLRRLLPTYTFMPEDLYLSKGSPSRRRTMINDQLALLDGEYDGLLTRYNNELKKKNNLLKKDDINQDFLEVLNERIVDLGAEIIAKRASYLTQLNSILPDEYRKYATREQDLSLNYADERIDTDDLDEIKSTLRSDLDDNYSREMKVETSVVGPHRDKFEFQLHGRDLRKFGSQGEQRTAVIATYFANLALYRDRFDDWPVLIFDDILSELDRNRGDALLENLPSEPQIFMTTATRNPAFKKMSGEYSVFKIKAGEVNSV